MKQSFEVLGCLTSSMNKLIKIVWGLVQGGLILLGLKEWLDWNIFILIVPALILGEIPVIGPLLTMLSAVKFLDWPIWGAILFGGIPIFVDLGFILITGILSRSESLDNEPGRQAPEHDQVSVDHDEEDSD